jgi:hypothetical protein
VREGSFEAENVCYFYSHYWAGKFSSIRNTLPNSIRVINSYEMDEAFSTHGENRNAMYGLGGGGDKSERDHLKDLGIGGMKTLKLILKD